MLKPGFWKYFDQFWVIYWAAFFGRDLTAGKPAWEIAVDAGFCLYWVLAMFYWIKIDHDGR